MSADGDSRNRKQFTSVDWWFRDRHTGKIVIAQFPNVPLWIFLAAAGVGPFFSSDSKPSTAITWIGAGGLAWWALDEVIRGVNPWRRVLGIAGCAFVIALVISLVG
ncbi:MAG: hypothetical protein ABIP21_11215 [Acidimicrobiia bacterium]